MDEQEFNSLINNGSIKTEEVKPSDNSVDSLDKNNEIESFIPELTAIRRLKQDSDSVPTYTPKNFIDQFYLYLSGSTRKLYVWINKSWLELATGVTDHGALTGLNDNDHGAVYYTETEIDNFAVKLTGDQSVAGIKTFTSFPITPSSAPSTNYQVANKKYVDDNGGGIISNITLPFYNLTPPYIFSIGRPNPLSSVSHNPTTHTIIAMSSVDGEYSRAQFCRYERDAVTYGFNLIASFEINDGYNLWGGCVRVGSYIYLSWYDTGATTHYLYRYDLDFTNGVEMTLSGGHINDHGQLATDGTYIYIHTSTTQFKKITISGTTITVSGAITFGNGYNVDSGFGCDGTYVYGYDEDLEFIARYEVGDGTFDDSTDLTEPIRLEGIISLNGVHYIATAGYGWFGTGGGLQSVYPINIFLSNIKQLGT